MRLNARALCRWTFLCSRRTFSLRLLRFLKWSRVQNERLMSKQFPLSVTQNLRSRLHLLKSGLRKCGRFESQQRAHSNQSLSRRARYPHLVESIRKQNHFSHFPRRWTKATLQYRCVECQHCNRSIRETQEPRLWYLAIRSKWKARCIRGGWSGRKLHLRDEEIWYNLCDYSK